MPGAGCGPSGVGRASDEGSVTSARVKAQTGGGLPHPHRRRPTGRLGASQSVGQRAGHQPQIRIRCTEADPHTILEGKPAVVVGDAAQNRRDDEAHAVILGVDVTTSRGMVIDESQPSRRNLHRVTL